MELKDTLNLPQTRFPMRASLATREPQRMAHWQEIALYERIQEKHRHDPLFVLHDGPPFTNGDVHIGTALNKILKDIILRFKTMRGFRTPYIPGWDCHGLPIELKVAKQLQQHKTLEPLELRRECAIFSAQFIEKQRRQFQRLGLLADWAHEYRTMDPDYEACVLEFLAQCIDQGLVYRSKKPVYWSIPCRTALAEAEVEYREHSSTSIWVKFPLTSDGAKKLNLFGPVSLAVWTTTPWTLPANLAVAINPQFNYVALKWDGELYVVESLLAEKIVADCHWTDVSQVASFSGQQLQGIQAEHPFIDRRSPVIFADFVTNDAGTGCVHIAPGHGMDDYVAGLQNGLEIYSPLDDNACYENDGRMPQCLIGVPILDEKGGCPANDAILAILREKNKLLQSAVIRHSYPHCWRSKTPIIFRAMDQWFIHLEKEGLRQKVLEQVGRVKWIPCWGENRIRGALESRPDWCISRQRSWGIPLPVFFDENGQSLIDGNVVRGLAEKFRQHGSDYWFEQPAELLLDGISLPENWRGKSLRKGSDTLDVWIDSGNSCNAVLRRRENLRCPADLYCEGSDQHRGWFQSSLWCSFLSTGKAPYRSVLTHGFVVGENRKKISKSDGKPQTADDYVNRYGADVVRLWIASEDFRSDITLSENIFDHVVNAYQTLRNTLRFQLGNLYDFDPSQNALPFQKMLPLDQWLLEKVRQLISEVTAAYECNEFHRVFKTINYFCSVTLSALYHDILKDRLYTSGANWQRRRSAQTAIHETLGVLIRLLAPLMTFTADEAWNYLLNDTDFGSESVQLLDWPDETRFAGFEVVAAEMDRLFQIRDLVNREIETARKNKLFGKSLEARVNLSLGELYGQAALLKRYEFLLPELWIVSQVSLAITSGESLSITVERARGERCQRSWRWEETLYDVPGFGRVSANCRKVLLEDFSGRC